MLSFLCWILFGITTGTLAGNGTWIFVWYNYEVFGHVYGILMWMPGKLLGNAIAIYVVRTYFERLGKRVFITVQDFS